METKQSTYTTTSYESSSSSEEDSEEEKKIKLPAKSRLRDAIKNKQLERKKGTKKEKENYDE